LILETVVSSAVISGRFTVDAEASEGLKLARETGQRNAAQSFHAVLAWMAAVRGLENECRAHAAEVTQGVRVSGLANANTIAEWAVAMLDLSLGRPDATIARLAALSTAPPGVLQPFYVLLFTPDLVEALVRAGRLEEARQAAAPLEAFARPGGPTWAFPLAARCHALVCEGDEAEAQFAEALGHYTDSSRPFDHARTRLLFGEHLRRQRRRIDSRGQLRRAFDLFETLGAELWAERARAELRASGETARKRDPSTLGQLTPQELQIARFVADGLSNKEVAAQLFLSPRTVDHHLRHVFAKLGITSRTQLARLPLGEREVAADSGLLARA
jgi:ATP/maltotriose-dependent transcriptional regulator MalT